MLTLQDMDLYIAHWYADNVKPGKTYTLDGFEAFNIVRKQLLCGELLDVKLIFKDIKPLQHKTFSNLKLSYMRDYSLTNYKENRRAFNHNVDVPIAIIVPYYNGKQYIIDMFDSLECQIYKNFKVFIIYDGTPEEFEWLKDILHGYSLVHELHWNKYIGLGGALNHGKELVVENEYKYFTQFDVDNIYFPNILQRYVVAMENNPHISLLTSYNRGFVNGQEDIIKCNGYTGYRIHSTIGLYFPSMIYYNPLGDASAIYRTCAFEDFKYPENKSLITDMCTWNLIYEKGLVTDSIPEILFGYRIREDSYNMQVSCENTIRFNSDLYPIDIVDIYHILMCEDMFSMCSAIKHRITTNRILYKLSTFLYRIIYQFHLKREWSKYNEDLS